MLKTIALRINDNILNKIDKFADAKGLNRSIYIRQAIIAKLEDDIDVAAAEIALKDVKKNGTIPWEKFRKELGLKPRNKKNITVGHRREVYER